jgi:hypothetical protein
MDTFHSLGDNDDADNSDGDSQKNIFKETKFTVTSSAVADNEAHQDQVIGWGHKDSSHV